MANWPTIRLNLRYYWKALLLWAIGIGGALAFFLVTGKAAAWVSDSIYQPFPDGEATVIINRFCLSNGCPLEWWEWEELIQDAVDKWDAAGSSFVFHTRQSQSADDPCNLLSGEVAVIWTDGHRVCSGDPPLPTTEGVMGLTPALIRQNAARIYMYAEPGTPAQILRLLVPTILTHEFGHVLGLGHPDEAGQSVDAIMNSVFGPDIFNAELLPDDIAGIQALYGEPGKEPGPLVGFLENPRTDSSQSGIGVISGWVCEANEVLIEIDGQPQAASYGTERLDTRHNCGDTNNGFGLLFNWNLLEDGRHSVVALVDGVELGRSTVTVTTLGEEFLQGADGEYILGGFPDPNSSVVIRWEESLQNFVIVERR